jgi:hypothetical protein
MPRRVSASLVYLASCVLAPAGYCASLPSIYAFAVVDTELAQVSLDTVVRDTAKQAAALQSPLVFMAIANTYIAENWHLVPAIFAFGDERPQVISDVFYTASHPDLVLGFKMDSRWGTSLASEKAKLVKQKHNFEGDTVRIGTEDASRFDDGAEGFLMEWLSWR